MRRVRVEWQGTFSIEEVLILNDENDDYGLYQIYGCHVIFGSDSLLYIGMARDQTFGQRLGQHDAEWLCEEGGCQSESVELAAKITLVTHQIGQIGGKFSAMSRLLKSTGTHRHTIQ